MGSIPEIVVDRVTGFLCEDVAEAVARVPQLGSLSRTACRAHVEATFSLERMIDRYEAAYAEVLRLRTPPPPSAAQLRAQRHDWWDRPMAFTDVPPRPRHAVEDAALPRSG